MNKLVILAAGMSSRMRKDFQENILLSKEMISDAMRKPKSMIRIGNDGKPFLDYLIGNAICAGYHDIVIVVNEKDKSIPDYYSTNVFPEIKISFAYQRIPEGREKPFGTADALLCALISKPEWSGSKFTMCNSDNLYSIEAFTKISELEYSNALIDYERDSLMVEKERVEKFAVTKKDDERFLIDIIEKPNREQVGECKDTDGKVGVSMNLFSFSYDMILAYLKIVPLHPIRQEKEIPRAIKMMLQENPKSLFCYPWKERVPDLTNKKDILEVQLFIKTEFQKSLL